MPALNITAGATKDSFFHSIQLQEGLRATAKLDLSHLVSRPPCLLLRLRLVTRLPVIA
jgi:hypothetical protein